ncbi:MAG: hypothetical protein JO189_07510 [Deltaproteobacteria bacterium]|nr:hypothetical protein [Deltaproteobacteria bacterium]
MRPGEADHGELDRFAHRLAIEKRGARRATGNPLLYDRDRKQGIWEQQNRRYT